MVQQETEQLHREVVDAKNHNSRNFKQFTNNFHIIKAALRYYAVKQEMSFTSTKINENFPIALSSTGSSLKVLEELEVIQSRTESSHQNRFMPQNVDLEKLEEIERILVENREVNKFSG